MSFSEPRRISSSRRHDSLRVEPLEQRCLLSVNPTAEHVFRSESFLSAPAAGDALEIARDYLVSHATDLGLEAGDLANTVVTDRYTSEHNGVTHIYLRQTLNDLEINGADLNVNISRDGEVINVGSSFLANLDEAGAVDRVAKLSPAEAIRSAATALGYTLTQAPAPIAELAGAATRYAAPGLSLDEVAPRLHYAFDAETGVELAWNFAVRTPEGEHWYDVSIDSGDGRLLHESDWIDDASYNVLPVPIESPSDGARSLLTDPHDATASPFGWHDTNGAAGAEFTDTRGNNVSAQEDQDANNSGGARPSGGAPLLFDFPFNDTTTQPVVSVSASTTNLFYWNNITHDIMYQYGFDEVSGNFQTNNYGNGGAGNDPVQADDLDGSGTNNANFGTPPDGSAPRMQMFRFTTTAINRDSSMENTIIVHEYGHGISNRLTGGPSNVNALDNIQSGGMGEGWGDWWALMLTQKPTDTQNAAYPVGTYVLGQAPNGPGIRRQPYSYNMAINNQTLGDYNSSNEVHDAGELWCSALWDMNWLLIEKYGFDPDLYNGTGGNNLALQLVMDGLKLQPANPSFIQARDAIILADDILTGGDNLAEIWTAFARRGWGLSASTSGSNSTSVVEAFDLPELSLAVSSTSPSDGTYTTGSPTAFVINFNDPYVTGSVDLTDFSVNGLNPTSFAFTDADTLTFNYSSSPVTAQGPQSMVLVADSILRASDNDGVKIFNATFFRDNLSMAVIASTPSQSSNVTLPLTTVRLDFNEAVSAASLGTGDLVLAQGQVVGVSQIDADTVEYQISGVVNETTFVVNLPAGAVSDTFGNPGPSAFALSFNTDIGTVPFPTPLDVTGPGGALIFDPPFQAGVGFAGDVDAFTIDLEANTTLSVLLDPATSTLQPIITVRDPGNVVVATTTAGAAGQNALVQTVAVLAGGVYTVSIGGATSTIGNYSMELTINAAVEAETYGGAANGTRPTAQNISGSFVTLGSGLQRAAVVGKADSGGIDYFAVDLTAGDVLTAAVSGIPVPAALTLSLENAAGATLATGAATGSYDKVFRGLSVPSTGTYYLRVANGLVPYALVATRGGDLDTDANETFATALNISGTHLALGSTSDGVAKITAESEPNDDGVVGGSAADLPLADDARGSFVPNSSGLYVATLTGNVSSGNDVDWDFFRIHAKPGDSLNLQLNGVSLSDPFVHIFSATGTELAFDDDSGPGLNSLIVFANFTYDGDYYLVGDSYGAGVGTYTMIATLTTNVAPPTLDEDYYQFAVTSGEVLSIATRTPYDGAAEPTNALDPSLALYNPSGTLVASDSNSASDGRNAQITYTALVTGNYRVRVKAQAGTRGAYVVDTLAIVDTAPPTLAGVTLGSTTAVHADYLVPTGSGEQLRTVPVGAFDQISVSFGEDVVVSQGDLTLSGNINPSYAFGGFSYNAGTFTATWTLAAPILADELSLVLADTVTDSAGNALDGEFDNPTSLSDPTSDVTAGDGLPGGDFEFHFTVLAGDADRNNVVSGADFTIWNDGFGLFAGTATFTDGDFTGDGFVTGGDFNLWADHFDIDQTSATGIVPVRTRTSALDTVSVDRNRDTRVVTLAPRAEVAKPRETVAVPSQASVNRSAGLRARSARPTDRATVDQLVFSGDHDWLQGDATS